MDKVKEKGLQKFTDFDKKVSDLFKLKQITPEDLKGLNEDEIYRFKQLVNEKYLSFKTTERDEFLTKIEPILFKETKNILWENNHQNILQHISNYINNEGLMPHSSVLEEKTKLSRTTISKHIKEYKLSPLYLERLEQFKFLKERLLARVYQIALEGDVRAMKLFFDVIGNAIGDNSNSTYINTQNNYIQINEMKLSQESIKKLTPEQLTTLENIIKSVQSNNQ